MIESVKILGRLATRSIQDKTQVKNQLIFFFKKKGQNNIIFLKKKLGLNRVDPPITCDLGVVLG